MEELTQIDHEINFEEIQLQTIVGRGTFGIVHKALWRNQDVAVKCFLSETEREYFLIEVKTLSRVNHHNIIKLYGACTKTPVCLVMEYAEGGSLYDVLHIVEGVEYSFFQAINWSLQCAEGVNYLHSLKPKPLVHRDLKPPNLLLNKECTIIKMCDFGTACDIHTNMTNNRGSAAWMAPEVFSSAKYSEKCDVYSWGIILWEILSRRKPFADIGGPAYAIMWAVHQGTRPPKLRKCPKVIDDLMDKCWSSVPNERPSMSEVVDLMQCILNLSPKKAAMPITLPRKRFDTIRSLDSFISTNQTVFSTHDTKKIPTQIVTEPPNLNLQVGFHDNAEYSIQSDIPGLNINKPLQAKVQARRSSIDLIALQQKSNIKSHRRSGSYGSNAATSTGNQNNLEISSQIKSKSFNQVNFEKPDLDDSPKINDTDYIHEPPTSLRIESNAYLLFESRLQPIDPDLSSPKSMQIYGEHCKLAEEYLFNHVEAMLLIERKKELQNNMGGGCIDNLDADLDQLLNDKRELIIFEQNLRKQLSNIKRQEMQKQAADDGGWVWVDQSS